MRAGGGCWGRGILGRWGSESAPSSPPTPSTPALEVVVSEGSPASLPCTLASPHPGDAPRLVLWFREEEPAKPIYTVDLRGEQ